MAKTYTAQIRVLLCQQCGAPLESATTGGLITCGYCNVQNRFESRRDDVPFRPPDASAPMDENERVRRLRMQDGKPMMPPPSLVPLMDAAGAGFLPGKVDEAFHIYQATRREVLATHSPEAAERLYFLTMIANAHLGRDHDHARRRALLETSLETLTLPRHRQVLRAQLANAAAKEGDIESAEAWLRPCDVRSDDLDSDSAYRVSRAYLDTARRDFQSVVNNLGYVDDAYPVADAWDELAAVLRANALERLGHMDAAVTALRARMQKGGPMGRSVLERIRERQPELELCPQSFPMAVSGHAQVAAVDTARRAGGNVGTIFMFVGIGAFAFGLVMLVALTIPEILAAQATGASLAESLFSAAFGAVIVLITTVPLGLIFFVLGYKMRKSGKEAAWLRVHGLSTTGTVRGYTATGTSINDVPLVMVHVEVRHPAVAPYVANVRQLLTPDLAAVYQPGATVAVRVHPTDPQKVVIETN